MKRLSPFIPIGLVLTLAALRAGAVEPPTFPPVSEEERALTAVPGEPNAPAVVLFKKGEFLMAGYGRFIGSLTSHLRVQARVKILTEAGKSNGEIVIDHSDEVRLRNFSGRTVLPDGRIVPVPADATFRRRASKSSQSYVTAVAFPAVQVGAILDYQFEITFASPFVLSPWYLSEELPVRHAEIVYRMARGWTPKVWTRAPPGAKLEQEKRETPDGAELRAWAEGLPAIQEAPYGPPFADLATQILLLPESASDLKGRTILMGDWAGTTGLVNREYNRFRSRDWDVASRARKVAGDGSPRKRTEALYRFVRDEVQTEPGEGALVGQDSTLQDVLAKRRGTAVEKALLLQRMLLDLEVRAYLVWAADRDRGTVDFTVANPAWFDTVLVLAEVDGKRILLDPSSPSLGFGQLRADYEGTRALVFDTVQQITLSETPFERNLRRAEIDLALDEHGRLAGHGTLTLTGLRAVERLHWKDGDAQTLQAWKDWLEGHYPDFRISEVRPVESPDERKVAVTWTMAQREEEALEDEATLVPSAPLGPAAQPFLEAERALDLIFDYASRDDVELRLRWPEAWKLEGIPLAAQKTVPFGGLTASVELDAGQRTLVYRRRFDLTRRTLSAADYEAVRGLFAETVKSDAQKLTLVRR
jgi:hypothetical protein